MRIYKILKGVCRKLNIIEDYVIKTGTSGIWTYQKWNNGKIEAWGNVAATFPASTQMTTYRHRSIYSVSLSSLMTEITGGSCPYNSSGLIPHVARNGTTKSTLELMIIDAQSFAGFSAAVPVYVTGKWK